MLIFKKGQLFVLQQVFLSVAALLHDFCPFVQWCLLVGEHDGCLLFQTEITSTWFFAVDGGLFDDPPLQIVLDPPSLEFPDMCWQRSVLELAVPLGWRVERVVPFVCEGTVVMVNSLPQSVLGQTRVDLELWDPQSRNGMFFFYIVNHPYKQCFILSTEQCSHRPSPSWLNGIKVVIEIRRNIKTLSSSY